MAENRFPARGRLPALLVEEQIAILLGREKTGRDGVDANTWAIFLRHMHREPLGEVGDCGFGGAVCGNARERTNGVHGGDIDNAALPARRHVTPKYLTG